MNLKLLRILTVVLPLLFLAGTDLLRHTVFFNELHSPVGFAAAYAVLTAGVIAFSWGVFNAIGRLQTQMVEQNRKLAALNQVAGALAENTALQDLLERALTSVLETMRVEAGLICTLDQEQAELTAACHRGLSDALAERVRRQKLADAPVGARVVRTRHPVVLEHVFDSPDVTEMVRQEGIHSLISVPLQARGEVTGILAVLSHHSRSFAPGEVEVLTNLGNQLGMAIRNAVLHEQTRRTNEDLSALVAVGRAAGSSLEVDQMLRRALGNLLEAAHVAAAEVWTVAGSELVLAAHRGEARLFDGQQVSWGMGLVGRAADIGSPLVLRADEDESGLLRAAGATEFAAYGAWPLVQRGTVLGVLAVGCREEEGLAGPFRGRLFEGIAEQLATALENAFLHRQVQDAAVIEERERIAHEMHDSLAQVLGYINTQVLALRRMLQNGSADKAMGQLAEMQQAVQQLYADVREGILGLRSSPGDSRGLAATLEDYLERYRSMAGFDIALYAAEEARTARLPHSTEVQVMRIIQEALSNVRKHANATRATVRLSGETRALAVEVSDDGSGFDPSARASTGWPHFGLQTMRERAESVGGRFSLESAPGMGTTVRIVVPAAGE